MALEQLTMRMNAWFQITLGIILGCVVVAGIVFLSRVSEKAELPMIGQDLAALIQLMALVGMFAISWHLRGSS